MNYDLVVIGAGPAGLALSQCLNHTYNKILIIEREAEIGGLHRVIRQNYKGEEVFTEHSPRIYSSTYKNFQRLLKEMETDFYDIFIPYNFSMSEIGGQTVFSTFTFSELFTIMIQFFRLILNCNHGKDITIGKFMISKKFNKKTIDMVDRLTRLTDGAGIEKYTLYEFLQLFNQQFLYKLYQPKLPNDKGLFKIWSDFLTNKGVEFMLETTVKNCNLDTDGNVKSITVIKDGIEQDIFGDKFVLALPPQSFLTILQNSVQEIRDTFMEFNSLETYVQNTEYMTYISLTFHWDKKLNLPKVYGFPRSEWGIAYIVLSDYMSFSEEVSKTVISCTITFTNSFSSFIKKTANQCGKEEIISETFRQLQESYPNLEEPTLSLLSPELTQSNDGIWQTSGKAFITASNAGFLPFVGKIPNLYNVGTHNGKCEYAFTSMETAVTNSIYLSHIIDPKLKRKYRIKRFMTVRNLIFIVFLILLFIILIIIIK